MDWLKTLYIFATVFGIGVLIVDLMGILNQDSDGDSSEAADGEEVGDGQFESDADGADDENGSDIVAQNGKKSSFLLKTLSFLQSIIYFSLGFGTTGLFAVYTGESPSSSLIWSLFAGFLLMFVVRFIRRLQGNVLDSQIKKSDLLLEIGEIIVPVEKGQIGKVRINYENQIVDRFAKAKDATLSFSMGEKVRIEEVSDEFVFIEKEVI